MKYLLIFCLFVSLISCKENEAHNVEIDIIDVLPGFNSIPSFVKDTTYIPLEFCENCIIGDISKVLKTEDGFIISDRNIAKQVFKFDDEGNFLFKIGASGEGLGNYVLPFDISLIPGVKRVAVLDQNQMKIIYYSLVDGAFIEEIPINFQAKSFHFLSDELIALHFDGQFSGREVDSLAGILDLGKRNFVYKGVVDYSKTDQNNTAGDFFQNGNNLLFSKSLNDTIYKVDENGFEPKFILNFGDKKVSDEIKSLPLMDMRMRMMEEIPFYHNGNIIENEQYLFFLWWGNGENENFSIYDKKYDVLESFQGEDLIFKRPFFLTDEYLLSYLTNKDYEKIDSKDTFLGKGQNHLIIKVSFNDLKKL